MIRNLLIIAGASFVLMLACTAGVAALAGPTIIREGWTIPFDKDGDSMVLNPVSVRHSRYITVRGGQPAPLVSRDFPWTGESLTIDLPIDVTYVQGPVAKIEVKGPKPYVDRIRVENGRISLDGGQDGDGESLTIDVHGLRIQSNTDRMRIVVTAPDVSHFQLDGSGDLAIQNYNQPGLTLALNGSGDIDVAGKTKALALAVAGSGDAELDELAVRNADVSVAGSGNTELNASNVVKIAISGSGDVSLQAQPSNVSANISGSGTVRHDY